MNVSLSPFVAGWLALACMHYRVPRDLPQTGLDAGR